MRTTGVARRAKQVLLHGPLAPVAVLPSRIAQAGARTGRVAGESARWLATSREHTNFTYNLSKLNREHLAWFVSLVGHCSPAEAHQYFVELESDDELRSTLGHAGRANSRRRVSDAAFRWHRHLGWYALVRARRPEHVVETGTDKGLGTMVLASAVRRNGAGHVTTIDVMPDLGYLIQPPYQDVVTAEVRDSLSVLTDLAAVDLFIHDSLHTREHEAAEFHAVAPSLTPDALVLSDNAHVTDALPTWASATGRQFLYWQEQPDRHWYPGGGIGAAWSAG